MKGDGVWDAKAAFARKTQRFLRVHYPNWRKNKYYLEQIAGHARHFRPVYYNYGEQHLLVLLYLSRFLPKILYKQILRADHVLVYICRYIRWCLIGNIRKN